MDLISCSLNALDQFFSTRKTVKNRHVLMGHMLLDTRLDSWGRWKIMYLLLPSVQDVENTNVIGFMITGFLLIDVGGFLMFHRVKELSAAQNGCLCRRKLPPHPIQLISRPTLACVLHGLSSPQGQTFHHRLLTGLNWEKFTDSLPYWRTHKHTCMPQPQICTALSADKLPTCQTALLCWNPPLSFS